MIFKKIQQVFTFKKKNLITLSNTNSIISDQFRTIGTNLQFLSGEKRNQIYLITPIGREKDTSTITANLTVTIAQQKEKVLLIDANLRDPMIHNIFQIPNQVGLVDILLKESTLKQAVSPTGIGQLDILTSGITSTTPSQLFGSEVMENLLKKVAQEYSMVFIVSPTLLKSTETRVLANQCDGVILILNRGKTGLEKVVEARRTLELAQAKLVGAILND